MQLSYMYTAIRKINDKSKFFHNHKYLKPLICGHFVKYYEHSSYLIKKTSDLQKNKNVNLKMLIRLDKVGSLSQYCKIGEIN